MAGLTDDDILALEQRGFAAWPAVETRAVDGWLLRHAGGCTKRANSANALAPRGAFEAIVDRVEAFYAARRLPAIFRLTPLAPPEGDAALAARGYRLVDPSLVLVAPVAAAAPAPDVEIADRPSAGWLDAVEVAGSVAASLRPVHRAIVGAIAGPAAFATVRQAGAAVGFGFAVRDQGMIGLFDIVVAPDARGRGHGRAATRALIGWGAAHGAFAAYLQVAAANATARSLYASLGFTEAYRYHYRVEAG